MLALCGIFLRNEPHIDGGAVTPVRKVHEEHRFALCFTDGPAIARYWIIGFTAANCRRSDV
jgi:hypothetical protein